MFLTEQNQEVAFADYRQFLCYIGFYKELIDEFMGLYSGKSMFDSNVLFISRLSNCYTSEFLRNSKEKLCLVGVAIFFECLFYKLGSAR